MTKIIPIAMPKWGMEMTEGLIAKWNRAEGEAVSPGEDLIDIETDKMTNVYESEFTGILRRRIGQEGETYPVGQLLGVVADAAISDAEIDAFVRGYGTDKKPQDESAAPAAAVATGYARSPNPEIEMPVNGVSVKAQMDSFDGEISPIARRVALADNIGVSGIVGTGRLGRVSLKDLEVRSGGPVGRARNRQFISPRARKLAREKGIDPQTLSGSGANGRILAGDVDGAAKPFVTSGAQVVRMSPMRKAIARQLSLSKSTIPHFYLRAQLRMDALIALRSRHEDTYGNVPSINDYLVRACALALMEVPDVNVQVHGDEIHRFAHADISVAVATDKGLLTPIVRTADRKSVVAISSEIKSLAEKARAGSLKSEDYHGGSFSLSNLGMFGIDQFDAIINPPQGAILAVGATRRQPIESNYALAFASVVEASLSCDHRAIDGAVGARFMAALRELIEAPERLTAVDQGKT